MVLILDRNTLFLRSSLPTIEHKFIMIHAFPWDFPLLLGPANVNIRRVLIFLKPGMQH